MPGNVCTLVCRGENRQQNSCGFVLSRLVAWHFITLAKLLSQHDDIVVRGCVTDEMMMVLLLR